MSAFAIETSYTSGPSLRPVKHHLVVPPEPFEEDACDVACLAAGDFTDATFPVDGIDQRLLSRVYRQVKIRVCMRSVYQDRRRPSRQPLLNAECIRHAKWNVIRPCVPGKIDAG